LSVVVKLTCPAALGVISGGGAGAVVAGEFYFDHTSGRHHRQRVVLWRGEDALNQASIALGRQIDTIASQVRDQLSNDESETGHVVDSVELNFGVKVVADAGKALGVFTVSGERAVQVKVTLKRSPSA
jgi:hypothetical protein